MKALRTAADLNSTVWRETYLGIKTKARIVKALIRSTMTYKIGAGKGRNKENAKNSWKAMMGRVQTGESGI